MKSTSKPINPKLDLPVNVTVRATMNGPKIDANFPIKFINPKYSPLFSLATVFLSQISLGGGTPELSDTILKIVAGTFAIIGHIWTVFAGFKGGKGVGTAAGFLFGLIPLAATVGLIVFFTVFLLTRYVSLGSMIAAISIPSTLLFQRFFLAESVDPILISITVLLAALIIFTHRSNISRLIKGTENRISNLKGGSQ